MLSLIPQWKSSWRLTSMQAGWALGLIDAAYAANFWELQDRVGMTWFGVFNAVVVSIVIPYLRNIQQSIPLTPEVKKEIVETIKDSPTKTPSGAVVPPQPIPASHRITQEELDHMMDRRILKHEELKARKPRKRRTPTAKIAAQFNPPGEVK